MKRLLRTFEGWQGELRIDKVKKAKGGQKSAGK